MNAELSLSPLIQNELKFNCNLYKNKIMNQMYHYATVSKALDELKMVHL
jgi:hypothetical protein